MMFDVAYEKAEMVLKQIRSSKDTMLPTREIIKAVEELLETDIKFALYDFSSLDSSCSKCCAAINACRGEAKILLNKDSPVAMQRFALVHSLGRLIIEPERLFDEEEKFKMSVYVEPDLTQFLKFASYDLVREENKFLLTEQTANIFALLVLIPDNVLWKKIIHQDSIEVIAAFFGVEKTALKSRLMLGCIDLFEKE